MRALLSTTTVAIALCFAAASFAQPNGGPGYGPGKGPQAQGQGYGPGKGPGAQGQGPRAPRFGSSNTYGWSMMSPQERNEFRREMLSAQTPEQCQAAMAKHRDTIAARAKERGAAAPRGPRSDMCQVMRQRGFFG
jgi:hypothetical protein